MTIPASYSWLKGLPDLPMDIAKALELYGTKEWPGPKTANPIIMGWAKELGIANAYSDDDVAWCGLFVAVCLKRAGKDLSSVGSNLLGSRNFTKFGVAADKPSLGDVLVFHRGDPKGWQGHVGFYIGEDKDVYYVLGGNQSNSVNITKIKKNRLLAARRPVYNNQPKSVKPYFINVAGSVSTNEA